MLGDYSVSFPLELSQLRAKDWVVKLDQAIRGLGQLHARLQHQIMQLARLDQHLRRHENLLSNVKANPTFSARLGTPRSMQRMQTTGAAIDTAFK